MRVTTRQIICILALTAGVNLNGWCEQTNGAAPGILDRIWAAPVIFDDNGHAVIQSFSLIGRYHGQYWSVNADQGDAAGWENRRKILGFSSRWFQHFTVQAQMYLQTDGGSLYGGLYEAFIKWSPPDRGFSLSVGRLDYLFTGYERSESSKKINVIERGLLVNQVMPAEVVGAHMEGKSGRFSYHAGLFSGSIDDEFGDFDSGTAAVVGVTLKLPLFYADGKLHLDYLHNSAKPEGGAFKPYRNIVSLWHRGERGRLDVGLDLTVAQPAEDGGHLLGLTIEPTWMLVRGLLGHDDALQFVLRYQYANSTRDNGLLLQKRYEQTVTQGNGNRYQAMYAGLNYFLYGQKLKLMAGGELARMEDRAGDGGEYRGWTWFGAVRLYF